jgi:hypothetical protein
MSSTPLELVWNIVRRACPGREDTLYWKSREKQEGRETAELDAEKLARGLEIPEGACYLNCLLPLFRVDAQASPFVRGIG